MITVRLHYKIELVGRIGNVGLDCLGLLTAKIITTSEGRVCKLLQGAQVPATTADRDLHGTFS